MYMQMSATAGSMQDCHTRVAAALNRVTGMAAALHSAVLPAATAATAAGEQPQGRPPAAAPAAWVGQRPPEALCAAAVAAAVAAAWPRRHRGGSLARLCGRRSPAAATSAATPAAFVAQPRAATAVCA